MLTCLRGSLCGVDVLVEGDCGPPLPAAAQVGVLQTRLHDVAPRGDLIVQGEVAPTRGLQLHLGFLSNLRTCKYRQ